MYYVLYCLRWSEFRCVSWTLLNLMENPNNVTEFVFIGLGGRVKKIELLFFSLVPILLPGYINGEFYHLPPSSAAI